MYIHIYDIYTHITYKMTACRGFVGCLTGHPMRIQPSTKYDCETQTMRIERTNYDWLMVDLWLWGGSILPNFWEIVHMMGTCIKEIQTHLKSIHPNTFQ